MAKCFGRIIVFTIVADEIVDSGDVAGQPYLLVGASLEVLPWYFLDSVVVLQNVADSVFVQPQNEVEQGVALPVVGYRKICRNESHLGAAVHS
jgi:hypothetical protein